MFSQFQQLDRAFTVCQDVKGFAAKELMVKLVGRKVLLRGKKETQSEDGKGFFCYKYEVFKWEWDLPEGVDPDGLTCFISSEGQLHIKAPRQALTPTLERNVPIQITLAGGAEAEALLGSEVGADGIAKA
uniref:SHSP domain-containing protein n=1 Tax=Crocodylus porosus TaxID=8502 RepID=A0A7M4EDG5_CROPO